jgi:hypothetical protein
MIWKASSETSCDLLQFLLKISETSIRVQINHKSANHYILITLCAGISKAFVYTSNRGRCRMHKQNLNTRHSCSGNGRQEAPLTAHTNVTDLESNITKEYATHQREFCTLHFCLGPFCFLNFYKFLELVHRNFYHFRSQNYPHLLRAHFNNIYSGTSNYGH